MKNFWLCLIVLVSSWGVDSIATTEGTGSVGAQGTAQPYFVDVFLLNSEARFVRGVTQDFVSRSSTRNFAIGGRRGVNAVLFEYGLFSQPSGNATVSVTSERSEYMLWWKRYLYSFEIADIYSSLGVGGYREEVRTTFYGATSSDLGLTSAMAGAGIGVGSLLFKYVTVNLEARLIAGSNFDPNPTPGILFRSGIEF